MFCRVIRKIVKAEDTTCRKVSHRLMLWNLRKVWKFQFWKALLRHK